MEKEKGTECGDLIAVKTTTCLKASVVVWCKS